MLTLEELEAQVNQLKKMIEELPVEFAQRTSDALMSPNFSTGNSGWKIDEHGNVEFNSGVFRGDLSAGSIDIPGPDPTNAGWHVDSSGNMWWGTSGTFASASIKISSSGSVAFTSGTFSGTLNAASGTLGTITAGTITTATITGGTVRTAATGKRVEMTSVSNALSFYDATSLRGTIEGSSGSLEINAAAGSGIAFLVNGATIGLLNSSGFSLATGKQISISGDIIAGDAFFETITTDGNISGASGANVIDLNLPGHIAVSQAIRLRNASSDPGISVAGALYYNSSTGKLKFRDGSGWRTVTSA